MKRRAAVLEPGEPPKGRRARPAPPAAPTTAALWPFVQLPWLLVRELSHGQALAYAAILRRAGGGPGECWAAWKTIGEDVGKSRSWARSRGYELRRLGLISIETRATEEGDCDSNRVRCTVFVRAGELIDLRGGYVSNQTHPPVSETRQGYVWTETRGVPESRHGVCLDPGTERESPERESPERDTHTARAAAAGPADEPGRVCVDHGVAGAGEEGKAPAPAPPAATPATAPPDPPELLQHPLVTRSARAVSPAVVADLARSWPLGRVRAALDRVAQHPGPDDADAMLRAAVKRGEGPRPIELSTNAPPLAGTRNRPSWQDPAERELTERSPDTAPPDLAPDTTPAACLAAWCEAGWHYTADPHADGRPRPGAFPCPRVRR